ncbi:MAG: DUF3391 domain-containing protein, partial [Azovibrio sp.]|uniref:DUF3391 domain-containing protein n=1 Tax=Azovibrio sp. TaxID=1872673 RepID=UPI003C755088
EKARKGLRAELTLKQKRGLMHDRFVLLKRERDLSDEERQNLDGWTKHYPASGRGVPAQGSLRRPLRGGGALILLQHAVTNSPNFHMLKKINVEHLRVGMHLEQFCGSWMDHPFWRNRFVITDPQDLLRIRANGASRM